MAKHTLHILHGSDYNQMSSDELRAALSKLRADKMEIDAKKSGNTNKPLPHPSGMAQQNRKSIARIMTILVARKEPCV